MELMTRKSFALVETLSVNIDDYRKVFLPLIAGDAGSSESWIKTTSVRDETRKTCGKDHLCVNMISIFLGLNIYYCHVCSQDNFRFI